VERVFAQYRTALTTLETGGRRGNLRRGPSFPRKLAGHCRPVRIEPPAAFADDEQFAGMFMQIDARIVGALIVIDIGSREAAHDALPPIAETLSRLSARSAARFAIVPGAPSGLSHMHTQALAAHVIAASADPDGMAAKAKEASEFLKALAHESRLMILCLLCEGEKSVTELEHILALRQPTVSQQPARLRAEGSVMARRDGKTMHYSLASEDVRVIIDAVHAVFCRNRTNS
jgi:DNA-binding transcriptional ArsR family regulator